MGNDHRLAEPDAAADPLVLLVLAQAVDAEVHPEAAPVDVVHAELARHRAQGSGAEERGRTAAQAVRRRPGRLDEPQVPAGEAGDRLAPRSVHDADVKRHAPELRLELAIEMDVLGDGRAVWEIQREHSCRLVEAGDDLLEDAEPLAVHEAVVLVYEEELPVTGHSGLRQLALVELAEREPLDRGEADPGDAGAHTTKPSCRRQPGKPGRPRRLRSSRLR